MLLRLSPVTAIKEGTDAAVPEPWPPARHDVRASGELPLRPDASRLASSGLVVLGPEPHPVRVAVKRLIDVVGALTLLLLSAPALLVVAALIRREDSGPVMFRQVRLGRHRRPFRIFKFRTMRVGSEAELASLAHRNDVEPPLFKVIDDPRVTRVGRVLRRWSIDELPQLLNVLLGHMSLVGPRPPLPGEAMVDGVHQELRLRVRPGITGLWQVKGRARLPYSQMVALDLAYVQRWSLSLDAWILLRTLWAVVSGRGAY